MLLYGIFHWSDSVKYCYITGHELLYKQSDIPVDGWAVECRVYAEVGVSVNHNAATILP